ncbi:unnamed protein product [Protopolystoma xenopodis]|uniref:Uncharacterized protein n=1 Tax=Protopolystoma xenopodis TaxID=117903 RepID=A0A3S5AZA0_9PLAT|nr:unnamed protein product [Protopolystoma xenopodis]
MNGPRPRFTAPSVRQNCCSPRPDSLISSLSWGLGLPKWLISERMCWVELLKKNNKPNNTSLVRGDETRGSGLVWLRKVTRCPRPDGLINRETMYQQHLLASLTWRQRVPVCVRVFGWFLLFFSTRLYEIINTQPSQPSLQADCYVTMAISAGQTYQKWSFGWEDTRPPFTREMGLFVLKHITPQDPGSAETQHGGSVELEGSGLKAEVSDET